MTITKRDLQNLIEVSQRDVDTMRHKNVRKMKEKFVKRFAHNDLHDNEAFDMTIEEIQSVLMEVTDYLIEWKNTGEWKEFFYDRPATSHVRYIEDGNGGIMKVQDWSEYLRETFLDAITMIKLQDLDTCPRCGHLFLKVGTTKKTYCTTNCAARSHHGR